MRRSLYFCARADVRDNFGDDTQSIVVPTYPRTGFDSNLGLANNSLRVVPIGRGAAACLVRGGQLKRIHFAGLLSQTKWQLQRSRGQSNRKKGQEPVTAQGELLAALPTPGDWCVLTDGTRPISESECDDVLLALDNWTAIPANREYKWKLQIVVPCLNREYARHHGFGFLHAQSLSLDLMQPMEMVADRKSWPVGQDRQELVRLCAPDTGLFVGAGGSGSIDSSTTGSKRGLTWCKVLLLKRSIQLHVQL